MVWAEAPVCGSVCDEKADSATWLIADTGREYIAARRGQDTRASNEGSRRFHNHGGNGGAGKHFQPGEALVGASSMIVKSSQTFVWSSRQDTQRWYFFVFSSLWLSYILGRKLAFQNSLHRNKTCRGRKGLSRFIFLQTNKKMIDLQVAP